MIVLLSDINMPGMDGIELLRETKQRWPELPIMMVTAMATTSADGGPGEYGAAEFITKPVDFEMLKECLRQLPSPAD